MHDFDAPKKFPLRLFIENPHREMNKLTTFFRIIMIIPIWLVLYWLSGKTCPFATYPWDVAMFGGFVVLPVIAMILFRQKYPRWWFDWNVELTRFATRVSAYILLLRDEYPSTDEEQAVHLEIDYPDVERKLNRWLPLVKWILVIPHIIILIFLSIAVLFCTIFAWFSILFTGRYPTEMFNFVVGVIRWGLRVEAYAILLVTDEYPPFSLDE